MLSSGTLKIYYIDILKIILIYFKLLKSVTTDVF